MLKYFYQALLNFPGEGNGKPLQYSCLDNPMDGGTWWATVQGVAKSQRQLKRLSTYHRRYYREMDPRLWFHGNSTNILQRVLPHLINVIAV